MNKGTEKPVLEMTFEESLEELEGIVRSLESGQSSLEESIRLFERGEELKKSCESHLKKAQLKLEKLSQAGDGKIERSDMDL